jgi:GDP-4-dehydro-6-deoxy-D-mannose reductase
LSRALVTGANGFAGSHLVRFLLDRGWEVCGVTNDLSLNPDMPSVTGSFTLEELDVCDRQGLLSLLKECRPEKVFHLAAITQLEIERKALEELYRVNVLGTQNLLLSVLEAQLDPVVLITSSSSVYGSSGSTDSAPLSEDALPVPETPYGASKLAQEMLADTLGRCSGLKVVRTRAFNHTGPGESRRMACSAFASQVAECELKGGDVVRVGNLDSHRDYCDVRDVVRAYVLVAVGGKAGEIYNVCSGSAVTMGDVLDSLVSMSKKKIRVETDAARVRRDEVSYQRGDGSKIERTLGWKPEIPLKKTLSDLLDYWRERLGNEPLAY